MPRALTRRPYVWAILFVLCQPAWSAEPAAEQQQAESQYIRILRDEDDRPTAMQTVIASYTGKNKDGEEVVVDLVGAIHVGDKKYYETLNQEFENYEVLLYELVAPEGTVVERGAGAGNTHPIGLLQNGLKGVLGLEHQMGIVDYTKENFVHADMSMEEMSQSMADRNESMVAMFFRMMGQGIAMQGKRQSKNPDRNPDAEMLLALFSNDQTALKRLMAEQFEDMEALTAAIEGPDGSTIVSERNKVALSVMAEQMDAGKTHIGIFYGTAHLPDMQQRLLEEYQMTRTGQRWLTAWDMGEESEEESDE